MRPQRLRYPEWLVPWHWLSRRAGFPCTRGRGIEARRLVADGVDPATQRLVEKDAKADAVRPSSRRNGSNTTEIDSRATMKRPSRRSEA